MTGAGTQHEPDRVSRPALRLVDAAYGYDGAPAVEHLDFAVMPGEAVAVIGANGSGKSTLLKGLLSLVPKLGGRTDLGGAGAGDGRGRFGYLPQHDTIDPEMPVTLRQIVAMGRYRRLGAFRWPNAADRSAVDAALRTVKLADRARTRFGDLSGGQRQRGLLARAIASAPRVLLLDEPFNGLDQPNRTALIAALRSLKREGVAILVSTHDLELAREVCDRVLLLRREQLAYGPTAEVLTLENVQAAFGHVQVELDEHTLVAPGHEEGA